ncbi:MAG: hypothetical protein JSU70_10540 [Phycisphaerales bacterium]|nr:MAG: hypothetical protein JSU70_10540 [Phycisphaerales bacterium]
MIRRIDVKDIDRKARRAFREDGLDTLTCGVSLAIMAIFFVDIRHGWALGLATVLYTIVRPLVRDQVTHPRIGYAKFTPAKGKAPVVLAIVAFIVGLTLFYIIGKVARYNWLMPLFLSVVLAVTVLLVAFRTASATHYALAALFLVSGLAGIALTRAGYDPGDVTAYQLWCLSGILVPVGLVQLTRFLRRYPRSAVEVNYGRQ